MDRQPRHVMTHLIFLVVDVLLQALYSVQIVLEVVATLLILELNFQWSCNFVAKFLPIDLHVSTLIKI